MTWSRIWAHHIKRRTTSTSPCPLLYSVIHREAHCRTCCIQCRHVRIDVFSLYKPDAWVEIWTESRSQGYVRRPERKRRERDEVPDKCQSKRAWNSRPDQFGARDGDSQMLWHSESPINPMVWSRVLCNCNQMSSAEEINKPQKERRVASDWQNTQKREV